MPNRHAPPKVEQTITSIDFWKTLSAVDILNKTLDEGEISRQEVNILIPTEEPVLICWVSDAHLFSRFCDHETFGNHIRMIKETDGVYIAWMGDLIDHGGKHGLASEDRLSLDEQVRALQALLLEMKDKSLSVVSGNHELFSSIIGDDPANAYLAGNSVPYFRVGGVMNLEVGKQNYKVLMHHKGRGGGGQNPNQKNKALANAWCPMADIVVSGHTHVASIEVMDRNENPYRKDITYIVAGTYKTGNDTYAKGGGYTTGHLGGISTLLYPDQRRMQTYRYLEHAIEDLKTIRKRPSARGHKSQRTR